MILDTLLDNQVGIQYRGEKDLSETAQTALLNHGVLIGKFKRGFAKPFVVTANTYQKLLGYDPNNDDYKAVEDFFSAGGTRLTIVRTGGTKQSVSTKKLSL